MIVIFFLRALVRLKTAEIDDLVGNVICRLATLENNGDPE
jgi:hypothetical protein